MADEGRQANTLLKRLNRGRVAMDSGGGCFLDKKGLFFKKIKNMNRKLLRPAIWALLFSGMGFMLLFVLVIFERSAFNLLFDQLNASDDQVKNVFNSLRMVVDVLPYMLGPFLLGTFVFGLIQAIRSKWSTIPVFILITFCIPMIWNITFADTAAVVETLKQTLHSSRFETIRSATQAVMQQHHLGLIGFGIFLIGQLFYLFGLIRKN